MVMRKGALAIKAAPTKMAHRAAVAFKSPRFHARTNSTLPAVTADAT
jgi:hypothetical protein